MNPYSAKTPNFNTHAARLDTFDQWPSFTDQDPDDLSAAGFFYLGDGDRVECYYCGSVVENWKSNDVPLLEHAKRFPHCDFINDHVSPDFLAGALLGDSSSSSSASSGAGSSSTSSSGAGSSSTSSSSSSGAASSVELQQNDRIPYEDDFQQAFELASNDFDVFDVGRDADDELLQENLRILQIGEKEIQRQRNRTTGSERDSERSTSETGNDEYKCKVCLTEMLAIAFIPCGHLSCNPCAGQLDRCHVCREEIDDKLRIYF